MKLAITCGTFDCLNPDHFHLIKQMRKNVVPDGNVMVLLLDDYAAFRVENKFPIQSFGHRSNNLNYLVKYVKQIIDVSPMSYLKAVNDLAQNRGDRVFFFAYSDKDAGVKEAQELKIPVKIIKPVKI